MEADGHHFGVGTAFLVEHVEGVFEVFVEVADAVEAAAPEAGVVGFKAVGQDQPGFAGHIGIVGEVVVESAAVVDEAAFGGYQFAGVKAGAVAGEPADGAGAGGGCEGGYGFADGFGFVGAGFGVIFLPAVAVAADFVAALHYGAGGFRVALHSEGATEEGAGDAVFVQQVEDAPDADAAAVFEEGFVEEVALAGRDGGGDFVVGFVMVVAVQ